MSVFRDFFVKEKPVFTGIARGVGGFAFGTGGAGGEDPAIPVEATGGTKIPAAVAPNGCTYHIFASTGPTSLQVTNAGDSQQRMEILVVGGGGGAARGGLAEQEELSMLMLLQS